MDPFETQINHARFNQHIYLSGNYESRITVYSQQVRATNLIYSLFRKHILNKDSKIAVIGAGAAGLTISATAMLLGCKNITLFEQGSNILPLWRDSSSRWLHPNIFTWPNNGWDVNYTTLPILNWTAGYASDVAKQIGSEWKILYDFYKKRISLKIHYNSKVRIIRASRKLVWGNAKQQEFDIIFLCVGFGRDGKKNDENTCYWANDNIPALKFNKDFYFLSGTGDGGISDLLRIRIKDFNLELLTNWLRGIEIKRVENRINNIETQANEIRIREDIQHASSFLQDNYEKIKTPKLNREMKGRLRPDTSILLHSRNEFLYNFNSFPLNRFLLSRYMQIQDNDFKHLFGDIKNLHEVSNGHLSRGDLNIDIEDYGKANANIFLSRHGPSSPLKEEGLKWIYDSQISEDIRARNFLDQTGIEHIYDIKEFEKNKDFFLLQKSIKKEIIVMAIIEDKETGKFLFTKRKQEEQFLQWGFPAKRVKLNYDVKQAIISECEQETGVIPIPVKIIGQRMYPASGNFLEYWYCTYSHGEASVKDPNELLEVKWMTGDEIVRISKDLFEPLKEILNGKPN